MGLSNARVRATIAVSDLTRAAQFYERTLGLSAPEEQRMGPVRIYPCGGGTVLQVYESEHAGKATATVASWSADDFDAVVEDLRTNGVRFDSYDGLDADAQGVHAFGEHRVVWFTDPDGNTLAVDNGGTP